MVVLRHPARIAAPLPAVAPPLPALLNKLRFLAMSCRCSARLDLFRACEMLGDDAQNAADSYALALMRTLPQALGTRPVIRAPDADPSFDELWLMRMIERATAGDNDSLTFLINSRVHTTHRHAFAPLIKGLSRNLPRI